MVRYVLILLTLCVSIIRYNRNVNKKRNSSYLLLSTFIQLIPLSGIIYKIGSLKIPFGNLSGATDTFFAIDALWIICIMILFFHPQIINSSLRKNVIRNNTYLYVLTAIEIISVINPFNTLHYSGLPTFFRIIQIYLFLKIISKYLSYRSVLQGLYDGFKFAIGLQFLLTILFPVLHITLISELFRPEVSEWAFRRDVSSALGTFMHPGALALFSSMCATFFLSCYLNNYEKKDSIKRIFMCLFIVYFTYSRTSYLAIIGTLFLVYFIYYNRKRIQIKSIIYVCLGLTAITAVFLLSPLADMFFKSDVDVQIDNRELHYLLALGCFTDSPLIGVGLNNHVNYLYNYLNTNYIGHVGEFFVTNPVHNSHLIILAETGIIGFILWVYYFLSRIFRGIKFCIGSDVSINIINLTFAGILIVYLVYGMTGWACFHRELYPIPIIIGFFSYLKKYKV